MSGRKPQYRDDEFLKNLGARIRQLRLKKNLTQEKLSELIEIDDSNLRKIESGKVNISISYLKKISEELKISLAELLQF